MAAGPWVMTDEGRTELSKGTFLDGDTYKIALFLSTSNIGASSTTYAGLTNEHANGNGYTTGGNAVTVSRSGTTTVTLDATDPAAWTASGGSIVARYAVLYEVGGRVLAYCLLDSAPADVTVTAGNTLTLTIHGSGVLTIA
jgi:hypothetical protein